MQRFFNIGILIFFCFSHTAVAQESQEDQSKTSQDATSSIATRFSKSDDYLAVKSTVDVNCWSCHVGNIELTYTPEIHKLHQGLLVASLSRPAENSIHFRMANDRLRSLVVALSVHNPLGVEVEPANPALRKQLKLEADQGLVLLSVPDDSEGAKIGLKPLDVLVSIDQHRISSGDQLQQTLINRAQKEVTILLMREGKLETLNATLPAFETVNYAAMEMYSAENVEYSPTPAPFRIGVTLQELEQPLRSHLKLADSEGLMISEVVPESPAATAGLQANDVLIRCNDQPVSTVEQINAQIQEIRSNPARFRLIRAGDEVEVEVTPRQETSEQLSDHVLALQSATGELFVERPFVKLNRRVGEIYAQSQTAFSPSLQAEIDALQFALDALKAKIQQSSEQADPSAKPDSPEPPK